MRYIVLTTPHGTTFQDRCSYRDLEEANREFKKKAGPQFAMVCLVDTDTLTTLKQFCY